MGHLALLPAGRLIPEDEEIQRVGRTDRRRGMDLAARKYRDRIFHHAAYILKDVQEAVDVTQEVFIKAMREPRFFEDTFKMKAWLFRVTSNLCFNLVRDRKRRSTLLERNLRPGSQFAEQVDLVFADERQQKILEAIDQLSEDHREILHLRYYSDLSYAEIADALDIKLGTVMSRLSRARGRLVEMLDDPTVLEG
jgi:RNA polymerase sigma-70 factor (ECF subfamily)